MYILCTPVDYVLCSIISTIFRCQIDLIDLRQLVADLKNQINTVSVKIGIESKEDTVEVPDEPDMVNAAELSSETESEDDDDFNEKTEILNGLRAGLEEKTEIIRKLELERKDEVRFSTDILILINFIFLGFTATTVNSSNQSNGRS